MGPLTLTLRALSVTLDLAARAEQVRVHFSDLQAAVGRTLLLVDRGQMILRYI